MAITEDDYVPTWDTPLGWMEYGACKKADPDIFFPERGQTADAARKYCNACDVIAECKEYAVVNFQRFGIWGGTSERERRALRKARGLRDPEPVNMEEWF